MIDPINILHSMWMYVTTHVCTHSIFFFLNMEFFQHSSWHLYILTIISVAIFLTYGISRIHVSLSKYTIRTKKYRILQTFVAATYLPSIIVIWLQVVANKSLLRDIESDTLLIIDKARIATNFLLALWAVLRLIKFFEQQLLAGHFKTTNTDQNTINAASKMLRVIAYAIVAIFLLPFLGIQITGIVAFLSGSAIILGIAAQQILGNYFGGIVVLIDSNFKVGDWIFSPDRQIEGVVEYIGWRSTHLRSLDRKLVYVPNSIFSSIIVINGSRMTNREIKDTIHIRYADAPSVNNIVGEINAMLKTDPELDKSRRLAAFLSEFGDFAIVITFQAFTYTIDWHKYQDIQQRIRLAILDIIMKHNAEIVISPAMIAEKKRNTASHHLL